MRSSSDSATGGERSDPGPHRPGRYEVNSHEALVTPLDSHHCRSARHANGFKPPLRTKCPRRTLCNRSALRRDRVAGSRQRSESRNSAIALILVDGRVVFGRWHGPSWPSPSAVPWPHSAESGRSRSRWRPRWRVRGGGPVRPPPRPGRPRAGHVLVWGELGVVLASRLVPLLCGADRRGRWAVLGHGHRFSRRPHLAIRVA